MFTPLTELDTNKTWTLRELSHLKAEYLIPSIVYLGLLTVIGVIGNAFVLIVFYFRFSPSTHRCFILVLAGFDMFACAVGAPFTMTNSFFIFTYTETISCRIFRFILYYTTIASSLTLVLIACERFRKICRPLKPQLTVAGAKKWLFFVTGIISTLSASPALVFFGNRTIKTGIPNVNGTQCFVNDYYKDTIWPTVFNIFLLVLAGASTLIMTVCYVGIARQVSRMGKAKIMRKAAASTKSYCDRESSYDNVDFDDSDIESKDYGKEMNSVNNVKNGVISTNTGGSLTSVNGKESKGDTKTGRSIKFARKVLRRLSSRSGKKTLRITKMLTFVTVAFVISYLPHLTMQLWDMFTTTEEKENSSFPTDNIYQVIFQSFLLNNLVNPFIYAAMDLKFRQELINLLKCKGLSP